MSTIDASAGLLDISSEETVVQLLPGLLPLAPGSRDAVWRLPPKGMPLAMMALAL